MAPIYLEAPSTGALDVRVDTGGRRRPPPAPSDGHLGETNMHSGGSSRQHDGGVRTVSRARTGPVIDELLARGALLQGPASGVGGSEAAPWTLVAPLLRSTRPSLLGSHLHWLVTAPASNDPRSSDPPEGQARSVAAPSSGDGSSAPRLIEDQVRILVRALDENDQDTVVTGALDERRPWSAGADASDASDVMRYAAELRRLTAGQPADSPYTALADSAFEVAAAIVAHRPGRAPAPGSTDRAEISPVRPDRARPSCPPSR